MPRTVVDAGNGHDFHKRPLSRCTDQAPQQRDRPQHPCERCERPQEEQQAQGRERGRVRRHAEELGLAPRPAEEQQAEPGLDDERKDEQAEAEIAAPAALRPDVNARAEHAAQEEQQALDREGRGEPGCGPVDGGIALQMEGPGHPQPAGREQQAGHPRRLHPALQCCVQHRQPDHQGKKMRRPELGVVELEEPMVGARRE
jgi:hypothetical protein